MKNKLELQLAAQATAVKCIAAANSRMITGIIFSDFDALNIDAKHFDSFNALANELAYQYRALEKIQLEPEVKPNPVPQPD